MADTDHFCRVRYSKDGGRNWSNWRERSLGQVGQYEQRVKLLRLGRARQWVFEIEVSSAQERPARRRRID